MSSKYGITCGFQGAVALEVACKAELVKSLTVMWRDPNGDCLTLPDIPGSYWARVRDIDDLKGGGLSVSYMLIRSEFWSDDHVLFVSRLAARWPSLTLFVYGDSFEGGDGWRALYVGGRLIVRDEFELDQSDRPGRVQRVLGEHVRGDVAEYIPAEYAPYLQVTDDEELSQEWDEVRAEVTGTSPAAAAAGSAALPPDRRYWRKCQRRLVLIEERIAELSADQAALSLEAVTELNDLEARRRRLDSAVAAIGAAQTGAGHRER